MKRVHFMTALMLMPVSSSALHNDVVYLISLCLMQRRSSMQRRGEWSGSADLNEAEASKRQSQRMRTTSIMTIVRFATRPRSSSRRCPRCHSCCRCTSLLHCASHIRSKIDSKCDIVSDTLTRMIRTAALMLSSIQRKTRKPTAVRASIVLSS